jgi:predicted O-methyltransferase YrrM
MTDYQFTKDWFAWAPQVWEQLIPMLPGEPGKRNFLEIGSFEGRSMTWIVENMMAKDDWLGCIDTWEGGEEHGAEDMSEVEKRFIHNRALAWEKFPLRDVKMLKGPSVDILAMYLRRDHDWPERLHEFHFIYIDGSHIAKDVLTDACMAWPLLSPNGIMVFDDYLWGNPRDVLHRPKAAIDAFTTLFAEELEIIHVGYQAVVRKKGE